MFVWTNLLDCTLIICKPYTYVLQGQVVLSKKEFCDLLAFATMEKANKSQNFDIGVATQSACEIAQSNAHSSTIIILRQFRGETAAAVSLAELEWGDKSLWQASNSLQLKGRRVFRRKYLFVLRVLLRLHEQKLK